jgi:hypothetical protein
MFIDRVGTNYYLGVANNHTRQGKLYVAQAAALFPTCKPGSMDIGAFREKSPFDFNVVGQPSQVKLVRDASGCWYLLAFRSDEDDDPNGDDYVDVYAVTFSPFSISPRLYSVHIYLKPGDTGFASTGTHYVERSGRLLVSSSYRWSKDEGPGSSSYVSRVDECPSS